MEGEDAGGCGGGGGGGRGVVKGERGGGDRTEVAGVAPSPAYPWEGVGRPPCSVFGHPQEGGDDVEVGVEVGVVVEGGVEVVLLLLFYSHHLLDSPARYRGSYGHYRCRGNHHHRQRDRDNCHPYHHLGSHAYLYQLHYRRHDDMLQRLVLVSLYFHLCDCYVLEAVTLKLEVYDNRHMEVAEVVVHRRLRHRRDSLLYPSPLCCNYRAGDDVDDSRLVLLFGNSLLLAAPLL